MSEVINTIIGIVRDDGKISSNLNTRPLCGGDLNAGPHIQPLLTKAFELKASGMSIANIRKAIKEMDNKNGYVRKMTTEAARIFKERGFDTPVIIQRTPRSTP